MTNHTIRPAVANAERFGALFDAMRISDIPIARPNFSRRDEATGLTLLSLALRLGHVVRVTESLRLINTDHLSRSVNVDVDLRRVNRHQREAITVADSPEDLLHRLSSDTATPGRRLWIPISRHSREDLAPVVVKDAGGNVVPRLTSVAATNAIIAGVTRLFRIQAVSQIAEVTRADPTLSREEDHRARWLVELAIAHLIQHGRHANEAGASTDAPADRIRRRADRYLRLMREDQAQHFADLLKAASQEYFLIVMLPEDQALQFLTCEAPLIPAVRSSSGRRRAVWSILPVSTEFTVDYTTLIPRAVDSYHVTMDVPEEIDVRRFILSSNADRPAVEDLGRRIKAVAAKAEEPDADRDKSLTVERRELETALGVLGQRRLIDVRGFSHYLHKRSMARRGHRAWKAGATRRAGGTRTQSVDGLALLRGADADVGFRSAEAGALLPAAELAKVGAWFEEAQLGLDVSTDNDPRENGAHAQWRPAPLGFGHPTVEPVEARVFLAMADEPPALVGSVARMLVALLFVVVGIKAVALGDPRRWSEAIQIGQADAAVAVLLIVPGVLLARLDIFSTHSVLGQLRRFPVAVAYFSVVITTTLALFVAAQREDYTGEVLSTVFSIGALVLLILLALCGMESAARWVRRHVPVPRSATVPVWLRENNLGNGFLRADSSRAPDVFFDAIRPVSNTIRVASREYERKRARWEREETGTGSALTEGPALLAELTARAVSKDYRAAWIEIRHGRAGLPGTIGENLDDLLYVSFAGNYCQILSGYVKDYEASAFAPLSPRTLELTAGQQLGDAVAAWSETAEIPPVVIRANVHDVDLLIGFGHVGNPDRRARRMLAFLDQALTCAAEFSCVVPTLVLAPASTPANVQEQPEEPQLAVGRTMRLTLTMPQSEHEARLGLESKLARLARDLNVDLWRASRSPGAGQGDWQRIASAQPRADDATSRYGRGGRVTLVPVTFVGGRGADSVGSFRKLTKALLDADIHVNSLTASVVGQHAIVHLALAGPSPAAARCLNGVLTTEAAFIELARRRIIAAPGDHLAALADIKFTACIGLNQPSRRWLLPWRVLQSEPAERPVYAGDYLEPRRSLWVDWQLPSEPSAGDLLAPLLLEYCAPMGPTEILYWRVHRTPDDEIRGRAKLAVQIDESQLDALVARRGTLGEQAKLVQSEVTRRLVTEVVGLPANAVYLHVVWSEPWLVRRRGV